MAHHEQTAPRAKRRRQVAIDPAKVAARALRREARERERVERAARVEARRAREAEAAFRRVAEERDPNTRERGASSEDRAVTALVAAGYLIVARNWTNGIGELDVIARDGDVLVFVEVRSRADDTFGHAAEMVTPAKQRQVSRVAAAYLDQERPAFDECRFDVVAITGAEVDILPDAWRLTRW